MNSWLLLVFVVLLGLGFHNSFAENFEVKIPFGAYDPSFNTPADNWYEPPVITIEKGDSVTWINEDVESHTVTSGQGAGRFGWMNNRQFGTADGIFDSQRLLPEQSWSYTFEKAGLFTYYCRIHPWMEGAVVVGTSIPDYPHDATGKKIEKFPIIHYTADKLIEVDLTWEPNVIKTNEKVTFIYQTYDPSTNSNLDKMQYDFIIIQNGEEIFRDQGLTGVGGDYRNFVFENPGPIEIRFENIQSWGTSGIESPARAPPLSPEYRQVHFTTMVYENPENILVEDITIKPAKRVELQYEILVLIIVIPGGLTIAAILYMMYGKSKARQSQNKSPL